MKLVWSMPKNNKKRLCCQSTVLLITTILHFTALIHPASSQRLIVGCYDAEEPIICKDDPTPENELDFLVEDVCLDFALNWLPHPNDMVLYDTTQHRDYLNQIDSDSEFCYQIREAYSHCVWCHYDDWIGNSRCFDWAYQTKCGEQPTLEEVLADTSEKYAEFETVEDVEATCAALHKAYSSTPYQVEPDEPMPASIGLCRRQELVKHLCEGFCDGGCFTEDKFPPTCDPNAYQGKRNKTVDDELFISCQRLETRAFYREDVDVKMNQSKHLDYLRAIPNDEDCAGFQQVYSQCIWCAESYCFDDHYPASCEAPTTTAEQPPPTIQDAEDYCELIYFAFFGFDPWGPDLFNASLHTGQILMQDNTTVCDKARQVYHQCFWCAPDADMHFCLPDVCDANHSIPDDFQSETLARLGLLDHPSPQDHCDLIRQNKTEDYQEPFGLHRCYDDVYIARLCPEQFCPDAEDAIDLNEYYLGAYTTAKKRALIWLSRSAAFLSFCGASYILYDILTDRKNRTMTYHQLLVGMAIFDIVTAVAWAFATAPIDSEEGYNVEGAIGNKASCTAQAFFIQLGLTSVFYNVSLATYYVLVVAYAWRDFQLEKIRIYLHAVPLVIGFGLAFGGIPFYGFFEYGCHLLPPPLGELWTVLVFFAIPLGLSIAAITASMMVVYCTVRKQAAASRQWTLGVGQVSRMEQAVFYQCLFYVLAFYVTWPIMFSVYTASIDSSGPYALSAIIAFVAPLQGFNNFLVYIRPKLKGRQQPNRPNRTTATTHQHTSVKSLRADSARLTRGNSNSNFGLNTTNDEQTDHYKREMEPIEEVDGESTAGRLSMGESKRSRPSVGMEESRRRSSMPSPPVSTLN